MNPAVAPRALLPALVTRALAGGGLHFACSLLLSPFAALASADATWLPSETDFDTEAPQPTPVVLVHGLFSRPGHFRFLHRFLVVRGFQNFAAFSYAPRVDHEQLAGRLGRMIEAVCEVTGAAAVDVVGHSLGGPGARSCSVHLLGRGHRPEDGRAVVMDEEPAPVAALEDVRRLDLRLDLAVAVAALDVLGEDHPGEAAAHLDLHVGEREAHLERA